jgi:hypothetical protein
MRVLKNARVWVNVLMEDRSDEARSEGEGEVEEVKEISYMVIRLGDYGG